MLRIEFEREEDGRWIAEIASLPGVMAYGASRDEARGKVEALALRTLADRIEHGEDVPEAGELFIVAACNSGGRRRLDACWSLSSASAGRSSGKADRTACLPGTAGPTSSSPSTIARRSVQGCLHASAKVRA